MSEQHSAERVAPLTEVEMESLCDAFVQANRAEFMDWWTTDGEFDTDDPDAPIFRAIGQIVRAREAEAWEVGNNAGLTFAAAPQNSLLINPYTGKVGRA